MEKIALIVDKEQINQSLAEMARQIVDKIDNTHLTDWINEKEAANILGYSNMNHMRMVARENGIKISKRGKMFYYSLKNINKYITDGIINIES